MEEIRELFEIQEIINDIDWSLDVIGSNKLYEPVFREQDGTEDVFILSLFYREIIGLILGQGDRGDKNKINKNAPLIKSRKKQISTE